MVKTNLYFFFPYMEETGVPMLFSRVSKWLASHYGNRYEVYVVDYADGAMARNLAETDNLKLKEYGDEKDCYIEDEAIIIMQSNNPKFWPRRLKLSPKTRVFWWTLHIRCLAPSLLPQPFSDITFKYHAIYKLCSLFYYRYLHQFAYLVDDMIEHGSLFFMDEPNLKEAVKHLPMKHKTVGHYLPVPAGDYDGPLKSNPCLGPIKLCWLGRVELEKLPILDYTLRKASEWALNHQKKIEFYVLGYGKDSDYIDNLPVDHEWFIKHKVTPIKAADINSFLLENVDAMFALATSSLEAAKLGIPTIMLDSAYKPLTDDYIYHFITERKGCELTHVMGREDFKKGNDSFNHIMDGIINRYEDVGRACRDYFVRNHSLSNVGETLACLLNKTSFTFDMINPNLLKPFAMWDLYLRFRGKMY